LNRFQDLCDRKGYVDDGEFDWTGRNMSTPVSSLQTNQEAPPASRDRHRAGKDGGLAADTKNPAWSESKPSGIDRLGQRLGQENRHPSVQVCLLSFPNKILKTKFAYMCPDNL
jgi:casein kinase 1 gamma